MIHYDEHGICRSCGSTGYILATTQATHRCPCHGWRPIETAPEYLPVMVGAQVTAGAGEAGWAIDRAWRDKERSRWWCVDDGLVRLKFVPTHWQYLPRAPEVGQ